MKTANEVKRYNRADFIKHIIESGSVNAWKSLLKHLPEPEFFQMLNDPSFNFDNALEEILSMMTNVELKQFAKEFDMSGEVDPSLSPVIRNSYYVNEQTGEISIVEVLREDYWFRVRYPNAKDSFEVPHQCVTPVKVNAELLSKGVIKMIEEYEKDTGEVIEDECFVVGETTRIREFVEKNFNDSTVEIQIERQREIIRRAKDEIERLEELKAEQDAKPWYRWDGIQFIQETFNHIDGYMSHRDKKFTFTRYEEFVAAIICVKDETLRKDIADLSLFSIESPKDDFDLKKEEVMTLPLVVEYFERRDLVKGRITAYREMKQLGTKISSIEEEIKDTSKYSEVYIQTLKQERDGLKEQYQKLDEAYVNSYEAKRIHKLDHRLREVDRLIHK